MVRGAPTSIFNERRDKSEGGDHRYESASSPTHGTKTKRPPNEGGPSHRVAGSTYAAALAAALRRRARASSPPQARIRPGMPAPTMGPGTLVTTVSTEPL